MKQKLLAVLPKFLYKRWGQHDVSNILETNERRVQLTDFKESTGFLLFHFFILNINCKCLCLWVHEHPCAHIYEIHQLKRSCTTAWKIPKDCNFSNHCPVTLISFSQIWVKGLCLSTDCLTCKSAQRLDIAFNSINRFEPFIMFLCKVTKKFQRNGSI